MSGDVTAKPVKVLIQDVPYYKREYTLPITAAIQSKESWRWPPPERSDYSSLDRVLNATTLTTQCVTHKQILEHGENVHAELTSDLRNRINDVEEMQKNFVSIVGQEVQKIKMEMEDRYRKSLARHMGDHKTTMSDTWEQKLAVMLELEKEKIERLNAEWKLHLQEALLKQKGELELEYQKKLLEAHKKVGENLSDDIDRRVAEALRKQLEMLETTPGTGGFRDKLDRKIAEVTAQHKLEMELLRQDLAKQHEKEMSGLKTKWSKMCERYKQLLEFARNVERDYLLLQDDFRKFIDNVKGVGGQFNSSYLIRSKQHGLLVLKTEKTPQISMDKAPEFGEMKKHSQERQLSLLELAAAPNDPSFWPDSHFLKFVNERTQEEINKKIAEFKEKSDNCIPVKLLRPLDSDDIGDFVLPVKQPEKNGASFILSFSDIY